MVIIAMGEAVKTLDKLTNKELLPTYPGVEWKKVMGCYKKSVNAYDSSIIDIAIMNDLLSQEEIEVERYTDRESEFYQKYQSLLDDLDFHAC